MTDTTTKPKAKYLFLDLETEGRRPTKHGVLECAVMVTDDQLVELERAEWLVSASARHFYANEDLSGTISRAVARGVDEFVIAMHTANGLWEDLSQYGGDAVNLDTVVGDLARIIRSYEWTSKKPILAGNSVHFDRGFLPKCIVDRLSHQHLDVSSLNHAILDATGMKAASTAAHRAMADVCASVERARDIYTALQVLRPTTT